MSPTKRLYLRKDIEPEDIEVWIAEKIPPVPDGQHCEAFGVLHVGEVLATTYSWKIKDGHVCYSFICDDCADQCDPEYLADNEYPATSGGYAVVPKHCA